MRPWHEGQTVNRGGTECPQAPQGTTFTSGSDSDIRSGSDREGAVDGDLGPLVQLPGPPKTESDDEQPDDVEPLQERCGQGDAEDCRDAEEYDPYPTFRLAFGCVRIRCRRLRAVRC